MYDVIYNDNLTDVLSVSSEIDGIYINDIIYVTRRPIGPPFNSHDNI